MHLLGTVSKKIAGGLKLVSQNVRSVYKTWHLF